MALPVGSWSNTNSPTAPLQVFLNAGDYLELYGYQDCGATLAVLNAHLTAQLVGN
jgi:hypothetical protein